jgi:hypothetical protein
VKCFGSLWMLQATPWWRVRMLPLACFASAKNLRAVLLKEYHLSPSPTCRASCHSAFGVFIGQVRISKTRPSL